MYSRQVAGGKEVEGGGRNFPEGELVMCSRS